MGFDADGALWVAMSKRIIKLADPSSFTGDVSPAPAVALGLKVDPDLSSKILFRPQPQGLPIY
jgi:hypothetical protein